MIGKMISKMSGTSGWGNVIGPDVSFWQDAPATVRQIDFEQMRRAGAQFVIIRAGQGKFADPDFKYNWMSAKSAGIPRGSYWFYDPRESPISQANLFASLLKDDPPELTAYLDLEKLTLNGTVVYGNYDGWRNWKLCLQNLRVNLPRVGIYTAPSYWMSNRPQDANEWPFFKSFELWIANYGVSTPLIPLPWTSAVFWQFGTPALGYQYGCESKEIDMNYFYGTLNEFHNYFGLQTTEPEPTDPTGDDGMITETMWNELLKKLDNIEAAIRGNGGGEITPPATEKESKYNVVEKDGNINGLVVAYKTPDINETNVDRFPVKPPQVVTAINDWRDVPAGLVGWSQMSDIDKQNTWRDWVCLHESQIKNANGKWRAFPDIFLQGGTVRAEYCWMLRSCLGSKA